MTTFVWVGVGGALGSMARHGVNVLVNRWLGATLPHATAIVNIVGCLVIGLLAGLTASGQWRIGPQIRAFLFVGIMGGFTTFSSLGLDTFTLVSEGRTAQAAGNLALQFFVGLGAIFAGYAAATSIR